MKILHEYFVQPVFYSNKNDFPYKVSPPKLVFRSIQLIISRALFNTCTFKKESNRHTNIRSSLQLKTLLRKSTRNFSYQVKFGVTSTRPSYTTAFLIVPLQQPLVAHSHSCKALGSSTYKISQHFSHGPALPKMPLLILLYFVSLILVFFFISFV